MTKKNTPVFDNFEYLVQESAPSAMIVNLLTQVMSSVFIKGTNVKGPSQKEINAIALWFFENYFEENYEE